MKRILFALILIGSLQAQSDQYWYYFFLLTCRIFAAPPEAPIGPYPQLPTDPYFLPELPYGRGQYEPSITDSTVKETICQPHYVRDVRRRDENALKAFFRKWKFTLREVPIEEVFNFYAPLQLGAVPGIDNLHPEWLNVVMTPENRKHREEVYDWLRKMTCDDKISLTAARAVVDDYDLIHSGDLVFSGRENIPVYPPPFTTGRGYFDTHRFPGIIQFKRQKER